LVGNADRLRSHGRLLGCDRLGHLVFRDEEHPETEQNAHSDSAKRILDERLARGEIDPEEYRRLRDVMTNNGTRAGNGRSAVGVER
jgi:hypothetical protein